MTAAHAERGQVLPLVAIGLAVLMGFGGLAVDVGYWEYQQREQQNAADAAALGGAQQLVYSGCNSQTAANSAGQLDASSNGFANGGTVAVTISNPPTAGPYAGQGCAVSAQITKTGVGSWFTHLFGFANGATETTQAVAMLRGDNGCVFMLSPTQNSNFSSATVTAPQCSILINGSANFSGATVDAAAVGEANYSGSNNSGTFPGAAPAAMLPASDPCPEITGCADLTSNPPPTTPCTGVYSGGATLGSGCYNNLSLNGKTVTLTGGTYVLEGSTNVNMASITGTAGVTIYMPAGASANFNKVSGLTLTPQTTGPYAGVTYYQVSSNSNDVNFNGSSTSLAGLVYAPSAKVNYNGSRGQYAVLVAAYGNLNNSTGEDFGAPGTGQPFLLQQAVLAQ